MTYYEENKEILDRLAACSHIEEIHGIPMLIKEVPDPIEESVLDPRIYKERLEASKQDNPLAAYEHTPVDLIRQMPAAATRDISTVDISEESRMIDTRNGQTEIIIYKQNNGKTKKKMMLFIHGGAYIAGHTSVVANFMKLLVEFSDIIAVGVEYRLAPEHKYPQGLHDCYDTVGWMYEHADEIGGDRDYIMVGGDSAGATLAIGCCMLEQEALQKQEIDKYRICYQALIYPAVLVDNFRMEDYRWRISDYDIPAGDMLATEAAFSLAALSGEMAILYTDYEGHVKDPLAAPLCAENLSYLPKTILAVCQYDYLRLQGEAFARKLIRENVELKTILYKGMDHEFVDKTGYIPQAYDLAREISKEINAMV